MNTNYYTARISNADPLELVIITCELIEEHLKSACKKQEGANIKGDAFKARQLLADLMASLDMTYDISKELMSIYIYINRLIIESDLKVGGGKICEAHAKLEEAQDIIGRLRTGWRALRETGELPKSEKLMDNTQPLYAGLTYKGGKLMEFVDEDINRGFKA